MALLLATNYANAVPVSNDAIISAAIEETATNLMPTDDKLDKLLHKTGSASTSSENVNRSQSIAEQTTQKPHNEASKPKMKRRRRGHRKVSRMQPDCRTTEKPTTTKPTKIYIQIPNLFISQSWGPGR